MKDGSQSKSTDGSKLEDSLFIANFITVCIVENFLTGAG